MQVKIPETDRNALRFLWYDDDENIVSYRMTSHLFGGIWCSSSSTYALGVFDWAVSWSTLKSWSTFRIRLVLHEISWSTKDVSKNYGDIFREVNHVMALLRQLRRCSSRQVLQILINSK